MSKGKVVQTELSEREYEYLITLAKKKRLTIKQGLREAIHTWIRTQIDISEDPLFTIEPVKTTVKTDSSKLDEALYSESLI